ncbi:unnamed protein product [Prorocentrum cordatum]|uniref:Solute carrier family 40 protein n=1 Tax=Prorocentrum cordatum TaxID=2364126 RepID=A0ABN9T9Q1_9DINO|nr:unnamed protein product [Polarella glacialis]
MCCVPLWPPFVGQLHARVATLAASLSRQQLLCGAHQDRLTRSSDVVFGRRQSRSWSNMASNEVKGVLTLQNSGLSLTVIVPLTQYRQSTGSWITDLWGCFILGFMVTIKTALPPHFHSYHLSCTTAFPTC